MIFRFISPIFILAALSIAFLFSSCSSAPPPKQPIAQASPEARRQFIKAQGLYKAKKYNEAMSSLNSVLKTSSDTDIGLSARFLIAEIYSHRGEYTKALPLYKALADSPFENNYEHESKVRYIQTLFILKEYQLAHDYSESQIASGHLTPEQNYEFLKYKLEANKNLNNYLGAIGNLIVLAREAKIPTEQSAFRDEALRLVEARLTPDDLRKVGASSDFEFLRAPALYKLGLLALERGDQTAAKDLLQDAAAVDKVGDIRSQVDRLLNQLASREIVNPKIVGAVLPLSGKFQKAGAKALHGLQLALGIYGKNRSSLELAVIDSEGNPDIARRAVERLIQEDRAIAIVGGLLSKEAEAIAEKAQELGVPSILLSQKSGINQAGDYIFQNAVTTQMQVRYLVDVAIHERGLKRFAVVYLNNPFGVEFANLFWDEVLAQGGEIRGAQAYDAQETDFRSIVQRLVGTFYVDDRLPEYKIRLAEWQKKQGSRGRKNTPKDLLPPMIDFDAVFIPDRAEVVGQVASMLVSNDVNDITIMGTDTWNTQRIVDRINRLPLKSLFVDVMAADDDSLTKTKFGTEFKDLFGGPPALFELHAYESGVMLRGILERGESTRVGLRQKLAAIGTFPSALGPVVMSSQRDVLRPLLALTVKDQKIVPATTETIH